MMFISVMPADSSAGDSDLPSNTSSLTDSAKVDGIPLAASSVKIDGMSPAATGSVIIDSKPLAVGSVIIDSKPLAATGSDVAAPGDPIYYNVVFHKNDGGATTTNQLFMFDVGENLKPNEFERAGYAFASWNAEANGGGAEYADGALVVNLINPGSPDNEAHLYAQWLPIQQPPGTYTVTYYDGRGAQKSIYVAQGAEHTILAYNASPLGFAAPASHAFGYWEGAGASKHYPGYTISGAAGLKAVWIEQPEQQDGEYKVAYNANGGTGSPADPKSYSAGDIVTVIAGVPTRPGYQFLHWENNKNIFLEGARFRMPAGNVTMWAQWAPNDYTVVFNANGGSGKMGGQAFVYGTAQKLSFCAYYRDNYSFIGWALSSAGAVEYANEQYVSNLTGERDGVVTLYARWSLDGVGIGPPPSPIGGGSAGGSSQLQPALPNTSPTPSPSPTPKPTPTLKPTPKPTIKPKSKAKLKSSSAPPVIGPGMFIKEHVAYILGYPDGDVRPNDYVTRAEVATVFYRLLADDVRMAYWTLDNPFADVKPGDWHNAAISVICKMEIIKGYSDGTFAPDDLITRGELAAVAARFASRMGLSGVKEAAFTDIQGHWAAADIGSAGRLGWINGYPDMTFMPDNFITRAEFITLANNILERIPETANDVLSGDMRVWYDNMDAGEWYYLAVQEATNTHASESKAGQVIPGRQFEYERWTGILENPDWPQLEKQWIDRYSVS